MTGGPDPQSNPMLRRILQNARAVNMPKDKVEAAIKRASGRDATNYETVIYEGYAPHGIALLVETATDNPTRTVKRDETIDVPVSVAGRVPDARVAEIAAELVAQLQDGRFPLRLPLAPLGERPGLIPLEG